MVQLVSCLLEEINNRHKTYVSVCFKWLFMSVTVGLLTNSPVTHLNKSISVCQRSITSKSNVHNFLTRIWKHSKHLNTGYIILIGSVYVCTYDICSLQDGCIYKQGSGHTGLKPYLVHWEEISLCFYLSKNVSLYEYTYTYRPILYLHPLHEMP